MYLFHKRNRLVKNSDPTSLVKQTRDKESNRL